MAKRIVILGALSAIAEAAARRFAADGAAFLLVGLNEAALKELAADLLSRGATAAHTEAMDLVKQADPFATMERWCDTLGGFSLVLIAYGVLGDQFEAEKSAEKTRFLIETNFTSAALWSQAAAGVLERQGYGTLMVIGSVAGDRGRFSNYIYGSAKGGLASFVQGIAHRLAKTGGQARAVVIKPGFVDTPMTAGLQKGGPLWATTDQVAEVIYKAADKGGPNIYAPWFWRWVMLAIRTTPAFLFHRTKL